METDFTRESTQLRFQRCRQRKANPLAQLLVPRGVSGWVSLQGPVHVWGPRFTGGRKPVESQQPVQRERDTQLRHRAWEPAPASGHPEVPATGTQVGSPRGAGSAGNRSHVISRCWLHFPGPQNISVTKTGAIQEDHNK